MSESILNALVHLFALVASVNQEGLSRKGKTIVETYLGRYLTNELVEEYLKLFEDYYDFYFREMQGPGLEEASSSPSLVGFQSTNVSQQLKKGLNRRERIIVFIQLLEFVNEDNQVSSNEGEIIEVVASQFKIDSDEEEHLKNLVLSNNLEEIDPDKLLVINNRLKEWAETVSWFMKKTEVQESKFRHIYKENLYGEIAVLFLKSIGEFVFRYNGEQSFFLESLRIQPGRIYFLNSGGIIKGPNIKPIYYNDISRKFFFDPQTPHIGFEAKNMAFRFKNSKNGIREFSFSEESGNLIGILGGSGVGKSTLLHLINGKLPPDEGSVSINGIDIHKNRFRLQGMIGFVPQDDLLIEELTVYQNLYYNASLCFADYTKGELFNVVEKILFDLDLLEIAHLKVGNPLKKFISGGQRKRLNIGLELMREPYILILDEPTSGLSSSDSEKIVQLLKEQTRKGRLVIATLHQPSSEIFKLLDKLWILDKGGYPVYTGNPVDAVVYFKKISAQVNAAESECPSCGTVNTEQILKILEARTLDESGLPTRERKIPPEDWYELYKENLSNKEPSGEIKTEIPESNFKIPRATKQFWTFSTRNLLAKLANTQYMAINLLEAPILALVLGFFTKYIQDSEYIFAENKNFPVFLFMSIVVALFMGLTVSAEEIIKDRRILERESFLNLSWPAYLSSKILYLFGLSALQTLTFVAISCLILDIKGLFLVYWLILFSTSAFGNLVGLNISSGLDSVIAIYVLIPLILVPQLLLGGAMIPFDDLNKGLTKKKYVPVVGDLMTTRWAYEALAVKQFKDNRFERIFFDLDMARSTANYNSTILVDALTTKLQTCLNMYEDDQMDSLLLHKEVALVKKELEKLHFLHEQVSFDLIDQMEPGLITQEVIEDAKAYLDLFARSYFNDLENLAQDQIDYLADSVAQSHGGVQEFRDFRNHYHNFKLAQLVTNFAETKKIYEAPDELVRKHDPIYSMPLNKIGRAHFYSPYKMLNKQVVETTWFNLVIIWLGTIILYFTLVTDLLRKILAYFRSLRLARSKST